MSTHDLATQGASLRQVRIADVVLLLWLLGWIVLAIFVGIDVHRLGRLSDTLANAGTAIGQVAVGIGAFGHLPFIGGGLSQLAHQLAATAASARTSAVASRSSVDQLSYLLAVAVALAPTAPVAAIYLPMRIGRWREGKAVSLALAEAGQRDEVERYLANRALANLSYRRLTRISPHPWQDVAAGRYGLLAEAELERLGFKVRPQPAAPG